MKYEKWLRKNTEDLSGKRIAITGSTGGIGKALCRHLLYLGAAIVLVDRNRDKSARLRSELKSDFPCAEIELLYADMEDILTVKNACRSLSEKPLYALILNAGAYSIPRHKCSTGYDNVFQINFLSPYFMARELMAHIEKSSGTIVSVGSIAHNYSKTDPSDVDFSERKKASLVYGNAKRYLMYALDSLRAGQGCRIAITHPGITFTGITDHYPRLIFAIIKHPMKIIFMKPEKASLSVLSGIFGANKKRTWIGPRAFDVWGYPSVKSLNTAKEKEMNFISATAEKIYSELK